MRCPDCNKFVSLDTDNEPEADGEEVTNNNGSLDFSVSVRIVNNCAECSTELREANFDISDTFDYDPAEDDEDAEYQIEIDDLSRDERSEGVGRGSKMFYGFTGTAVLSLDGTELERKSIGEDIQASHMDEL